MFSKDNIDFGTKVFLDTLLKREEMGNRILDVGCGYGPIGIIVKKTYPDKRVEMVDVNPRAVLLAKDNAQRNNVDVYAHESNIYGQVEGKDYYRHSYQSTYSSREKCYL